MEYATVQLILSNNIKKLNDEDFTNEAIEAHKIYKCFNCNAYLKVK